MQQPCLSLALALTFTAACVDDEDAAFTDPTNLTDFDADPEPVPDPEAPPELPALAGDFAASLADVQVITTPDEIDVIALDHAANEIGSLRVRYEADTEMVWAEAYYPDGAAWVGLDAVSLEEVGDSGATLPAEVLDARAEAILALLETTKPQEGWFKCAVGAGLTVSACGAAAASGGLFFVGCTASAAGTACTCISAWAERRGKRKCADS